MAYPSNTHPFYSLPTPSFHSTNTTHTTSFPDYPSHLPPPYSTISTPSPNLCFTHGYTPHQPCPNSASDVYSTPYGYQQQHHPYSPYVPPFPSQQQPPLPPPSNPYNSSAATYSTSYGSLLSDPQPPPSTMSGPPPAPEPPDLFTGQSPSLMPLLLSKPPEPPNLFTGQSPSLMPPLLSKPPEPPDLFIAVQESICDIKKLFLNLLDAVKAEKRLSNLDADTEFLFSEKRDEDEASEESQLEEDPEEQQATKKEDERFTFDEQEVDPDSKLLMYEKDLELPEDIEEETERPTPQPSSPERDRLHAHVMHLQLGQ